MCLMSLFSITKNSRYIEKRSPSWSGFQHSWREPGALGDVKDQLDRASTSIPLNIAEGNGKYTLKDRCRFFDIAHGSALECAAGFDILVAKGKLTADQIRPGKERLQRIVRMLMGLIKRNSTRDYRTETPPPES